MPHGIDDDRLVHYLAGECSEEEEAAIEAWIAADPAHRQHFDEMRALWQAAGRAPSGVRDVDRMWNRLKDRMRASAVPSEAARRPRPPRERARRSPAARPSSWRQGIRTAAVAVVAGVIALVAVYLMGDAEREQTAPAEPAMRVVATEVGQRARVTLRDGSQVVLNAESRLTLPPRFAEEERVVHLEGEAFFEVEPDAGRPFRIEANGAVTEVLGTKFNVAAYPDEPDVTVVVSEGRVAVRPEQDGDEQAVLLERHQLAQVSRHEERILRRAADPDDYMAWMQGRLVFKDAPIQEVARQLRRWFGLQVELAPTLHEVDRLNASFDGESVEEVLTIIAETLGLRYERNGQRVIFLPGTGG